jgi:hypothetical protein
MDKTFIKTSEGIIRLELISSIRFEQGEIHIYSVDTLRAITLTGKEAQAFLQFIPVAFDLSQLAKEEGLSVEVAGIKV